MGCSCFNSGNRNILQILKAGWWRYGLIALADVEANYTLVKAYQYTTLTSIQVRAHHFFYWEALSEHFPIAQCEAPAFQLLDCFVIPVLMVLSWFILKARYRAMHYVAVVICLLGVGAMVGADVLSGRDQGSCKDKQTCIILHPPFSGCRGHHIKYPPVSTIYLHLGVFMISIPD